jgi:hypothetical protein
MEINQSTIEEKELLELAKKRVKELKDFYIHLFIYAIGVTIYILKTYYSFPFNFFPIRHINWFVMAIWTFFLVAQAFRIFFSEVVFGKKWEDKKVKEILSKKSEKQTWE